MAIFARDPHDEQKQVTLMAFERDLAPRVFELGCTVVALFLAGCEERIRARTSSQLVTGNRRFTRKKPKPRTITTWFGPVRYWRTYMAEQGKRKARGHGFYPLDHELGLTAERFSFSLLDVVVRLATTLSFATAKATAELFLPAVPSTEVIEKATLGFGRFTQQWFESAPPPDDDGDVLVILFDGKGTPQATEEELELRRRPWKNRPRAASPRHRGRQRRGRGKKKPRRKPDDKSKNARMATIMWNHVSSPSDEIAACG